MPVIVACGSEPAETEGLAPAEIIGRIETSADIPAGGCRVLVEGYPVASACDESGGFDLRGVPPGRWDLRVVSDDPLSLPGKRVVAGANSGFITDLGAIRLAKPGSIGGRVSGGDLGGVIIALPAFGVVTSPNPSNGYLLVGAPPGVHDVVLVAADGTAVRTNVAVAPERTTIGVDFELSAAVGPLGPIEGRAVRGAVSDRGHAGLTVELVDAVTGAVETAVQTRDDGSFALAVRPGVFAVRARDGASPITAILPSVVPHGALPMRLLSPLVLASPGDLDQDGTPDEEDPDIDDDGVANAADAFPYDPAEASDVDGDGLGDRADLATQGAGVDTHTPTPDADGDGRFDFEDVCPTIADPAQVDGDGDGVGDRCDNCPTVRNDDQEDSVGNGVGDACRACNGSEDCADDLICDQGRCVGCVTSSQCGDRVCENGACVACSATVTCGGERVCNQPLGVCQECLSGLDCHAGQACVAGRCYAQCTVDGDCAGGFCVSNACVSCRDNADCASNQWCDAGLCMPGCTGDASCGGGRVCDVPTRTCILPCSASCPNGQTCDGEGLCRQACDLSFPCPGNLECDPVETYCVPQCVLDSDCGAFERCQLGQCVASGSCADDTDCSAGEMCGPLAACVPRPTAFDPVAGAYTCSSACECKLGEACAAGHCVADGVPARFVAAAGVGAGTAPDAPMADLAAALAGRAPGEVVAIRAAQTIDTSDAPIALPPGVTLQGGYVACSARRWVRDVDDLGSSRVRHTGAALGAFVVPGLIAQPRAGVTLRGLTLEEVTDAGGVVIDATYAPGLVVENVSLVLPTTSSGHVMTGIHVTNSTGVVLDRMRLTSYDGRARLVVIDLERAAGLVRDAQIGTLSTLESVVGIRVRSSVGPVTIASPVMGTWGSLSTIDKILVMDTLLQPVTITGGTFGWFAPWTPVGGDGSNHTAIHVVRGRAMTVTQNRIDGTGFIDPSASFTHAMHAGIWMEDAGGTVANNQVILPRVASAQYTVPYLVDGPHGDVTFDNDQASGLGAVHTFLVWIRNVTIGTTRILGGTYVSSQTVTHSGGSAIGLTVDSASVSSTDATFRVPGESGTARGFFVAGASSARFERCRFRAAGDLATTGTAAGGEVRDTATLELYGSWLRADAASTTAGLSVSGNPTVRIIGNTLDGGGSAAQSESHALSCADSSTVTLASSNLFDAGDANSTFAVRGECGGPSVFDRSYVHRGGAVAAGDTAAAIASAAAGVPDGEGDIDGGATGCFDPAFAPPDPRIASSSPCVNRGSAGARADGSPVTTDLLGGPRVRGAAADIGAHEVQ